MIKNTLLTMALVAAMAHSASAAPSYDQTITAIFGSGNPDDGWTAAMGSGITLALRGKDRVTASTLNVYGVYSYATGVSSPNRARWNWEFSINSGAPNLSANYDYYVGIDTEPSQCINYTVVDALLFWTDSSYGNNGTLNGQGVEGTAAALAAANNIVQQSQNLAFAPGAGPAAALLDATWNYELFAVAKGAGPNGARLASVGITVIVGAGGAAPVCDLDEDGVPDHADDCSNSDLSATVVIDGCNSGVPNTLFASGCTISDLIANCAASTSSHKQFVNCVADLANSLKAQGVISNKQKGAIQSCAGKSDIGK